MKTGELRSSASLAGRRIVLTRAPEQTTEWIRALKLRGAEVILMPLVSFEAVENPAQLDAALSRLHEFDWLLFTSQNAVKFVSQRLAEIKGERGPTARLASISVAAVGPATARTAEEKGWKVNYVSENSNGEGFAQALAAKGLLAGKRVLLPRSDRADKRLPDALGAAGAHVTEEVAYRTLTAKARDTETQRAVLRGEADAIVFASPSAFHNFCDAASATEVAALSSRLAFASVGPTTSAAIRSAGARVAVESPAPDAHAMTNALCEYFSAAPRASAHSTKRGVKIA